MSEPNKNILDGLVDFHGLKLRPLTIGTMELCRVLGLTMFSGDAKAEAMPAAEQIRQTAAYLWLQSTPLSEVLSSAREGLSPEAWHSKYVLPFMFTIPPLAMEAAAALIMENIERVGSAVVEVQSKPNSGDDDEPPNS